MCIGILELLLTVQFEVGLRNLSVDFTCQVPEKQPSVRVVEEYIAVDHQQLYHPSYLSQPLPELLHSLQFEVGLRHPKVLPSLLLKSLQYVDGQQHHLEIG